MLLNMVLDLLWECTAFHILGIGSWIIGAGVVLYSKF